MVRDAEGNKSTISGELSNYVKNAGYNSALKVTAWGVSAMALGYVLKVAVDSAPQIVEVVKKTGEMNLPWVTPKNILWLTLAGLGGAAFGKYVYPFASGIYAKGRSYFSVSRQEDAEDSAKREAKRELSDKVEIAQDSANARVQIASIDSNANRVINRMKARDSTSAI